MNKMQFVDLIDTQLAEKREHLRLLYRELRNPNLPPWTYDAVKADLEATKDEMAALQNTRLTWTGNNVPWEET